MLNSSNPVYMNASAHNTNKEHLKAIRSASMQTVPLIPVFVPAFIFLIRFLL